LKEGRTIFRFRDIREVSTGMEGRKILREVSIGITWKEGKYLGK
jgi:hypothetical protein